MGKNISKEKEEIVIAQAGNGAALNSLSLGSLSNIVEGAFIILAIGIVCYLVFKRCKKGLERKIRREVSRSTEQV